MTEELDAGLVAEQIAESGQLDAPTGAREIGQGRRRKEDARLLTGETRWTDNLALHERYGDAILPWLRSRLRNGVLTNVPWCVLPCLLAIGTRAENNKYY